MEMGDHSQTPLQRQFLLKKLSAQVFYVKLCAKSHCISTLAVHLLVVEQSMDLLPLPPYITGQSRLKHMAKNRGKLNIFMNCQSGIVFMTIPSTVCNSRGEYT